MRRERKERKVKRKAGSRKKALYAAITLFLVVGVTTAGLGLGSAGQFSPQLLQITTSPGPFLSQGIIIGIIALLITIAVAALVYLISGVTSSPSAKAWSRMQIYQALVTGLVLAIFVALFALVLVNPQGALQPLGVVPNVTAQFGIVGSSTGQTYNCAQTPDIFQLATCDLSLFNSVAFAYFQDLFMATMLLGIDGGFSLTISSPSPPEVLLPVVNINMEQKSLFPIQIEGLASSAFAAIIFFLTLVNVLLFLVAGSPLWLVFFVVLGLIARAFGVTRTFGGAMIALGIGLGIVLPVIIALTYGYLDVQLCTGQVLCNNALTILPNILNLMLWMASLVFASGTYAPSVIFQLAALIAGLTFIPFLSLTVLDAFIVDFSKALGERLDFMSLLTGLV